MGKHEELSRKKIAVVGLGGVGGYLGALLADAWPEVSFVARGARRKVLEERGLVLHSEYRGERMVRPKQIVEQASELEEQDDIFLCVKNYSLEQACQELGGSVGAHTVLIPVMNGVDPGERIRTAVPGALVLDSLIYIVSFANPDASITQQGMFSTVHIGLRGDDLGKQDKEERLREVHALLAEAGVDCVMEADIERAIWKKYIFNCAYNVETAAYNHTIGEIRRDPVECAQFEALLQEAYVVAQAKGVSVCEEDRKALLTRFHCELKEDATSSLQRDVNAGRTAELDTFSGYLVREAARLGVSTPVSEEMKQRLQERLEKIQTEIDRKKS